jgi:hypothetical protein
MAKKVKRILFNATFFDSGSPKWSAGQHYPVTEDTQRCIAQGIAEEISVDLAEAEQADLALTIQPEADADVKAAEAAPEA